MLQERLPVARLRRANELAPGEEHLAADGRREAGVEAVEGGRGRWRAVGSQRGVYAERAQRCGEPPVDRTVGRGAACCAPTGVDPERCDGSRHGVRDLMLVPHGAAARGAPYHVDPETRNRVAVVALAGRLVPPEGEARRDEAVQPQQRAARLVGLLEQPRIDRHVLCAGEAGRTDGKMDRWTERLTCHRSIVPTFARCLSLRPAHTPPRAGTRTPDCGRRTRRPRGPPTATPCAGGGPRPGTPPPPARRGGPPHRRSPLPAGGARSWGGCFPAAAFPPPPPPFLPESP